MVLNTFIVKKVFQVDYLKRFLECLQSEKGISCWLYSLPKKVYRYVSGWIYSYLKKFLELFQVEYIFYLKRFLECLPSEKGISGWLSSWSKKVSWIVSGWLSSFYLLYLKKFLDFFQSIKNFIHQNFFILKKKFLQKLVLDLFFSENFFVEKKIYLKIWSTISKNIFLTKRFSSLKGFWEFFHDLK
jgi:hypothetical protein